MTCNLTNPSIIRLVAHYLSLKAYHLYQKKSREKKKDVKEPKADKSMLPASAPKGRLVPKPAQPIQSLRRDMTQNLQPVSSAPSVPSAPSVAIMQSKPGPGYPEPGPRQLSVSDAKNHRIQSTSKPLASMKPPLSRPMSSSRETPQLQKSVLIAHYKSLYKKTDAALRIINFVQWLNPAEDLKPLTMLNLAWASNPRSEWPAEADRRLVRFMCYRDLYEPEDFDDDKGTDSLDLFQSLLRETSCLVTPTDTFQSSVLQKAFAQMRIMAAKLREEWHLIEYKGPSCKLVKTKEFEREMSDQKRYTHWASERKGEHNVYEADDSESVYMPTPLRRSPSPSNSILTPVTDRSLFGTPFSERRSQFSERESQSHERARQNAPLPQVKHEMPEVSDTRKTCYFYSIGNCRRNAGSCEFYHGPSYLGVASAPNPRGHWKGEKRTSFTDASSLGVKHAASYDDIIQQHPKRQKTSDANANKEPIVGNRMGDRPSRPELIQRSVELPQYHDVQTASPIQEPLRRFSPSLNVSSSSAILPARTQQSPSQSLSTPPISPKLTECIVPKRETAQSSVLVNVKEHGKPRKSPLAKTNVPVDAVESRLQPAKLSGPEAPKSLADTESAKDDDTIVVQIPVGAADDTSPPLKSATPGYGPASAQKPAIQRTGSRTAIRGNPPSRTSPQPPKDSSTQSPRSIAATPPQIHEPPIASQPPQAPLLEGVSAIEGHIPQGVTADPVIQGPTLTSATRAPLIRTPTDAISQPPTIKAPAPTAESQTISSPDVQVTTGQTEQSTMPPASGHQPSAPAPLKVEIPAQIPTPSLSPTPLSTTTVPQEIQTPATSAPLNITPASNHSTTTTTIVPFSPNTTSNLNTPTPLPAPTDPRRLVLTVYAGDKMDILHLPFHHLQNSTLASFFDFYQSVTSTSTTQPTINPPSPSHPSPTNPPTAHPPALEILYSFPPGKSHIEQFSPHMPGGEAKWEKLKENMAAFCKLTRTHPRFRGRGDLDFDVYVEVVEEGGL